MVESFTVYIQGDQKSTMSELVVNLESCFPGFVQQCLAEKGALTHDCRLVTEDGTELTAMRFVLALYSPFFSALLGYTVH